MSSLKSLYFKASLNEKSLFEYQFLCIMKSELRNYHNKNFRTWTCFEREIEGNLEMVYCNAQIHSIVR